VDEIHLYSRLANLNLATYFCRQSPWGGVALFVNSSLSYEVLDVSTYCEEYHGEFCAVLVHDLSVIAVAMYRSPSGSVERFFELLEICLTSLVSFGLSIVIGTDHNIDLLKSSDESKEFVNILCSYNIVMLFS